MPKASADTIMELKVISYHHAACARIRFLQGSVPHTCLACCLAGWLVGWLSHSIPTRDNSPHVFCMTLSVGCWLRRSLSPGSSGCQPPAIPRYVAHPDKLTHGTHCRLLLHGGCTAAAVWYSVVLWGFRRVEWDSSGPVVCRPYPFDPGQLYHTVRARH
jgi:hypothetical protein